MNFNAEWKQHLLFSLHISQSASISVPPPPPPLLLLLLLPPPAATMASLSLLWLRMCLASVRCIGTASARERARHHPVWYYMRPVERMTSYNQWLEQHIPARALHPALAHQVKPFWFLRAPSMPVTLSPVTTWDSAKGPYLSVHDPPFAGRTSPAVRTHRRPFICRDLREPRRPEKSATENAGKEEGPTVVERECDTTKSWPLDERRQLWWEKYIHT